MIRHRIIWTLREDLSDEEKQVVKQNAKENLEGLMGQIDGLLSICVEIAPLPSSTGDMMLDSLFADEASLKGYSGHPKHVYVANTFVRPYTATRACMDYESQE